jgi:hypothetical protein
MTIQKCAKCDTELRTNRGVIKILYPVFIKDEFVIFYLCRPCFIKADSQRGMSFLVGLKNRR